LTSPARPSRGRLTDRTPLVLICTVTVAWDTDDIDKWKPVTISQQEVAGPFLEESSFATLFPKYREKYLREMWPHVTRALDKHVRRVRCQNVQSARVAAWADRGSSRASWTYARGRAWRAS